MRLRLNTTLRAALIAAITAVGFTLTQAEAANTVISNASQSAAVLVAGDITLNNITSSMVNGGTQTIPTSTDYRNSFTYTPANIGNGSGTATYTLTFTIESIVDGVTAQGMSIDFFTLNGGGKPQNAENGYKATVALAMSGQEAPVYRAEHTILTYSGNNNYTGSAYEGNPAITPVSQASVTQLSLEDVEWKTGTYTLTIAFAQDSGHTTGCFGGVGNVAFLCSPPVSTWQGTEGNNNWTTSAGAWTPDFEDGNEVVFGTDASCKTVVLTAAVNTAKVTVEDNYTIAIQTGGSLNAGTDGVVIAEGKTLSLTGVEGADDTVTIGTLTGTGNLIVRDKANVTVNALSDYTGSYSVTDGGTLTVGFSINQNTLTIENATLNLGNSRHTIGTLEIGDGGVVNATGADNSNGCVSGDINIKAGGTFKMTGHHDGFGWGNSATKNIILTGESDSKLATLELNQTTTNSATMKTNIAMHGYSKITSANNSAGFNTYGGSIFAENTNNTIDKIQLRSDATIEVAAAGDLSVGNMIYGSDGNHNLTKTGEGTLTFTGAANMNSLTLNGGSVVFNGTSSIANGLTQAEGKSITVCGSLTLGGTVTFGHQAISVTGSGSIAKGDNLKFNLNGLTATQNDDTWTYTLFSGTAVDLNAMGLSATDLILEGGTSGKNWVFGTDGTISYTLSTEKVWTQEWPGNWNYEEANWNTDQKFEPGDVAVFEGEPMVTVNAEVEAGGLVVRDDTNMWLMAAQEGASLSSPSINIGQNANMASMISIDGVETFSVGTGSSWGISADQQLGAGVNDGAMDISEGCEVTITSLTSNGTVNVQEDASLYLGDTTTADELSRMSNDGTLSVALGSGTTLINMRHTDPEATQLYGTLVVRSGAVDYRSNLDGQTLQLGNGTELVFGENTGDSTHTYAGDIVVADGDTANIHTWGSSKHSQTTLSGDVAGEGTLVRTNDGDQALNFTGTVLLGGFTNNDAQDNNVTVFQGETTIGTLTVGNASVTKFTNESTSIGTITVNGSGTVEFAKSITLSSLTSTGNHALTLNATDGAEVTISGESQSLYKLATAGDIVIAEGTTLALANNLTPNSGTVTVNGTLSVGHEIDLSNGKTSTGKLIVASTGNVTATDGMWMCPGTAIEMKDGGRFTTKGLTFTGTGDTSKITYEGGAGTDDNYGVGKAAYVITDTAITANQEVTIGNKLVNSSVNTGAYAVTVNNANNTIAGATVGEGGSFTMTNGTLTDTITNGNGTVSLSGITLGDSFVQEGGEDTYVAVNGTTPVTVEDNYYLGNTKGYVTVVTGTGTVSGSNITWNEDTYTLQDDGTITTKEAVAADFSTFYLNKDSENISDILANKTANVQVNAGTLVVNQDASGVNITVTNEGTITGEHADATQIGIAKEGCAHYTKPVETSGVKFTAAQDDDVLIVNNGETTQKYTVADRNMDVVAQTLEMTKDDGDVTVSNAVYVDEIVNTTGKVLTLDNVTEVMELTKMDITGSTAKVGYITGEEPVFTEATVSISGVLKGGEATLLANLTLVDDSTLDLSLVGGGMQALTLGSKLTFDLQDGLVNLDQDTIAALDGLSEGQWLDLIVAADQTTLNYGGAYEGVSYDTLFNAAGLTGPYTVYAHGDAFGLVRGSQVPEPTTGTLSLLALAALAARRRRK